MPFQREVNGDGPGTFVSSQPFSQRVSPVAPEFRCVRGELEPMVTYEEEIVGAFSESIEWGETIIPTPEDFEGYDDGYIQQRISSSLESGCVLCTFFDLLLQVADVVYVFRGLCRPTSIRVSCHWTPRDDLSYIEDDTLSWLGQACIRSLRVRGCRSVFGTNRGDAVRDGLGDRGPSPQ